MLSPAHALNPSPRSPEIERAPATTALVSVHDATLVTRFNGGDEAAFVEIVTRYRGKMFGVGLALLHNRADAEEIAQDTFIRAHRGLARFRGDSSLATWLHRIATNLSRNRYWYFHRRCQHVTRSLDAAVSHESHATFTELVASGAPDPAGETAQSEFRDLVTMCMENLTAEQREILELRNALERSYEEIAETLGIKVGTVKSRIARARANLRDFLAQRYGNGRHPSGSAPWFEPSRRTGLAVVSRG